MNIPIFAMYTLPAIAIWAMLFFWQRNRSYKKIHALIEPLVDESQDRQEYYQKRMAEKMMLFYYKTERFIQNKISERPSHFRYLLPYRKLLGALGDLKGDLKKNGGLPQNLPSLLHFFPMEKIKNDSELTKLFEEWCTHEDLLKSYNTIFLFKIL